MEWPPIDFLDRLAARANGLNFVAHLERNRSNEKSVGDMGGLDLVRREVDVL